MAGVKSSLYYRNRSGGKVAIEDQSISPGDRFFVDSNTGTDGSAYGFSPDKPVATLDYAVGLTTASKSDIIYLMPGHAETLISATSAAVDVAGLNIWGIGTGILQPTFTLGTDAGATIAVTAADCHFKNIKLISDLANVAAGITASAVADGLIVEDSWLTDGAAAKELVIGISCAAACDRVIIRNNFFQTVDAGGCASAVKFVGATANSRITNNYMHGDYSAACIDGSTAAGTFLYIGDNTLWNTDTTAGLAVSVHASTTGAVIENWLWGGKDGTSPLTDVSAMMCAGNYYSNAAGASSALLTPATDA